MQTKLTIKRASALRKSVYRSTPQCTLRLQRCLAFYEGEAGRSISETPVVRRALELLEQHVAALKTKPERQDEVNRLMRNLM